MDIIDVKEWTPDGVVKLEVLFALFSVLRPHLDEAEFLRRVTLQRSEGYRMVMGIKDEALLSVAGFRMAHFLAWGKVLYVDDLITLPTERRQGASGTLLDWLMEQAKVFQCDAVHLDTGFARHDAHRLYLNKGFVMNCHRMEKRVSS